jgi:hypothetical protein
MKRRRVYLALMRGGGFETPTARAAGVVALGKSQGKIFK